MEKILWPEGLASVVVCSAPSIEPAIFMGRLKRRNGSNLVIVPRNTFGVCHPQPNVAKENFDHPHAQT